MGTIRLFIIAPEMSVLICTHFLLSVRQIGLVNKQKSVEHEIEFFEYRHCLFEWVYCARSGVNWIVFTYTFLLLVHSMGYLIRSSKLSFATFIDPPTIKLHCNVLWALYGKKFVIGSALCVCVCVYACEPVQLRVISIHWFLSINGHTLDVSVLFLVCQKNFHGNRNNEMD